MSTAVKCSRKTFVAAGVFGLTGVALGALGAHALAARLAEPRLGHAWETAARYHLFHALAIFGAAIWLRHAPSAAVGRIRLAVRAWGLGIVLFSGSLYGLALGSPRGLLGPVTPLGGIALMAGWVAVIAAAAVKEESAS